MVRVGGLDPYRARGSGVAALGPLEYRSSLIGGRLYLQLPAIDTIEYAIYKAVTIPTTTVSYGATVWGKVGSAVNFNGSGFTMLSGLGFFKDSGGFADTVNQLTVGHFTGTNLTRRTNVFNTLGDNNYGAPASMLWEDEHEVTVRASATNMTWYLSMASPTNGCSSYMGSGASGGVVTLLKYAGVYFLPGSVFSGVAGLFPYHYSIDYLRLYTGDLTNVWVNNL
jgi:hypothetical protein